MRIGQNNSLSKHINAQFDGANQDYPLVPIFKTVVTAIQKVFAFIID